MLFFLLLLHLLSSQSHWAGALVVHPYQTVVSVYWVVEVRQELTPHTSILVAFVIKITEKILRKDQNLLFGNCHLGY